MAEIPAGSFEWRPRRRIVSFAIAGYWAWAGVGEFLSAAGEVVFLMADHDYGKFSFKKNE